MALDQDRTVLDLLDSLALESRRLFIPLIDPEDGSALASLAYLAPPGLVVDLGAGIGYSTAWLAIGASANPSRPRIIAVEHDSRLAASLRRNARAIMDALDVDIDVVEGEALSLLDTIPDRSIGLAFVDVEKHQYPRVAEMLEEKLVEGGLAAFHNAYTPRPPDRFFVVVEKFNPVVIPTPQGLLVIKSRLV